MDFHNLFTVIFSKIIDLLTGTVTYISLLQYFSFADELSKVTIILISFSCIKENKLAYPISILYFPIIHSSSVYVHIIFQSYSSVHSLRF